MRVAVVLEYDGSAFAGWQLQEPEVRTVQACVEAALSRIADHPVRVTCAGRTDAGVHATYQVVHFDTPAHRPPHAWVLGANSHLPPEVAVRWAGVVPEDFHARFSAQARTYRYLILNRPVRPTFLARRVTWTHRPLDEARMAEAARDLVGEHDFSAYRALGCQAKSPVRTVHRLEVLRQGELVILEVEANAFLHHMVRNMAGVLMEIGAGRRPAGWAREVLEGRDRTLGGVTAPPDGLYLVGVRYPERYGLPALPRPPLVW